MDLLRWFSEFAAEKHRHSSDAVYQQLQGADPVLVQVQALVADGAGRDIADKERGRGRGKGRKAGCGSVVSPPAGVAAGLVESGSCGVAPEVLGAFLKFSTTALALVASSLLVSGQHEGAERDCSGFFIFWTLAVLLTPSHVKKVGFIFCMNPVSTALHRVHSVISDLKPPSGLESGEAALRVLLASRATEGYTWTSDDPTPGSLTVFQSSRVARPPKLLTACHC